LPEAWAIADAQEIYIMNVMIAAASGGVVDMLRDTADTFGWNWQLFLSQVVSFSIVVFLLRRFAYKPILAVLEDRRRRIEEGLINADKIKKELAEAEKRYQEIVAKANAAAQKMIDEARESSAHLAERKQQEAIAAAEQIIAKAREAASLEHERTMESMKRELGRLVVETTAKVTGKVLTSEDQKRLQEEAARQVA
jgi:F-type H+-transporting ATPase subunit b